MPVTYYQFEQNTNDIPAAAAGASPTTYTRGFSGVGGTLQSLLIRLQLVVAGSGFRSDAGALYSSLRVLVNGEVYFDYTSGFDSSDLAAPQPSTLGYLINSMGGRAYQVPTAADATTVDYYLELPMGAVLPDGVPRFEITSQFIDGDEWVINGGGGSITSGTITYWGIYNSATQVQTRTLASTSYQHTAGAVENVVVRVGNIEQQFPGASVAGILVQNDSAADEIGTLGIRPLALSQFGLPINLHRWANGDLNNETMAYLPTIAGQANVSSQLAFCSTLGALFIPTYNLVGGDIVIAVDSTTTTTRTYTPVIVSPINASEISGNRQSKASTGGSANTSKAIVSKTE